MHAIKVKSSKTQRKLICLNFHETLTFYAKLLTIFTDKIVSLYSKHSKLVLCMDENNSWDLAKKNIVNLSLARTKTTHEIKQKKSDNFFNFDDIF